MGGASAQHHVKPKHPDLQRTEDPKRRSNRPYLRVMDESFVRPRARIAHDITSPFTSPTYQRRSPAFPRFASPAPGDTSMREAQVLALRNRRQYPAPATMLAQHNREARELESLTPRDISRDSGATDRDSTVVDDEYEIIESDTPASPPDSRRDDDARTNRWLAEEGLAVLAAAAAEDQTAHRGKSSSSRRRADDRRTSRRLSRALRGANQQERRTSVTASTPVAPSVLEEVEFDLDVPDDAAARVLETVPTIVRPIVLPSL